MAMHYNEGRVRPAEAARYRFVPLPAAGAAEEGSTWGARFRSADRVRYAPYQQVDPSFENAVRRLEGEG